MLQNATFSRKSAPWPPNSSDEHFFCTAPATRHASLQILFKCSTPAIVFSNATKPSRFAHFWESAQSLAPATRNDIWTSKSGANMSCFVHFDFEMCFALQRRAIFRHRNFFKMVRTPCFEQFDLETYFAPQRRALFRHLNFQKWSEPGVFCAFWLRNVLRATTACNFSSLIWPDGSAPAALARLLFDPPEPRTIGKTQCFATFLPCRAPASSFFWLFLFSDLLSSTLLFSLTLPMSAFHLSILSEVWLLNFLRLTGHFHCHLWFLEGGFFYCKLLQFTSRRGNWCGGHNRPSGKLTYIWKITIFDGKANCKLPFSIAMLNYQRVHVNMHINVWCQDPWLLFIDKLPVPSTEEFHRQFQMRGSKHRDTVAWCSCCKAYLRIEYINTKWTGLLQPTIYTSIYLGMWFPQRGETFSLIQFSPRYLGGNMFMGFRLLYQTPRCRSLTKACRSSKSLGG